jgi:hypothetical protein
MHIVRWIVGVVFFVTCIFTWEWMHDEVYPILADLGETAHTYIDFHKVRSESDIASQYKVDTVPSNAQTALVPKILHHIWLQEHGDGEREKY